MASFSRPASIDGTADADATTLLHLRVTEPRRSASAIGAIGDYSSLQSDADQYEISGISRFSYTNDVMSIGDPWTAVVPDPRGIYRDRLRVGARVELSTANPNANGGAPTRKMTGRIRQRSVDTSISGGTVISLSGSDLGCHLQSNPPIWKNLRWKNWQELLEEALDPSWGFSGVRLGNDANARLNNGRTEKLFQLRPTLPLDPFARIEINPGQSAADLIISYARREGLLVNVSSDGYLQTFSPNYNEANVIYKLRCFSDDDPQSAQNNVLKLRLDENVDTIYTDVTCVAEAVYTPQAAVNAAVTGGTTGAVLGQGGEVYQADVHANKSRGYYQDRTVLPYVNRKTMADGDMYSRADAYTRAFWAFNRGRFDAWTLSATVRGHWQSGEWWESDTMCDCDFDIPGLRFRGNLYVSRVVYSRTDAGDVSELTLKTPNLLYEVNVR